MRKIPIVFAVLLMIGFILVGCQEVEPEPELPEPEVNSPTWTASPEPDPTETIVPPTETSTPTPVPTETPKAPFPEDLAQINYRTLSQVEELFTIPLADVIDLDFSPDGQYLRMRVLTGQDIHRDIFYDLESGDEVFSLEGGQRIYFNPDSTTIISLDNNLVTMIDLFTGNKLDEYTSTNQAAALSPNGQLLVEIEVHDQDPSGTTLRVNNQNSGKELWWTYLNGILDKEDLHFDGDGKYLAVTYFVPPGTYVSMVWRADIGRVMYTEYGYTEVILHPYSSEIALASGRRSNISLFSTVTWEQKLYLGSAGEEPGYYDVAYSTGGRLIYALSDRDKTEASFWYPPTGEKLDLDLDLDLLAVTISPDRRFLATSDQSGSVIIWGVPE
jgi:WD40 repeat protein